MERASPRNGPEVTLLHPYSISLSRVSDHWTANESSNEIFHYMVNTIGVEEKQSGIFKIFSLTKLMNKVIP